MRRQGFTLVELLVVVGIIGILLGLLFPVISMARSQAQMTECASRLRVLSQAIHSVAGDANGQSPLAGLVIVPDNGALPDAFNAVAEAGRRQQRYVALPTGERLLAPIYLQLAESLGIRSLPDSESLSVLDNFLQKQDGLLRAFACPAEARIQHPQSAPIVVQQRFAQYTTVWSVQADYGFNGFVLGADFTRTNTSYRRGRLSDIRHASNTLLMADVVSSAAKSTDCFWAGESAALTLTLADVAAADLRYAPRVVFRRHRGRASVLFLDGHVQTTTASSAEMRSVILR